MKKLFICSMILFLAVSCRLDDGGISQRNPTNIYNYSYAVYNDWAEGAVVRLEDAITLDGYFKLTQEERLGAEYAEIRNNLLQQGENTYVYLKDFVVDTGGKSILDPGTVWTISTGEYYYYSYAQYYAYYNGRGSRGQTVPWVIECTAPDTWKVSVSGYDKVSLEAEFTGTKADIKEEDAEVQGSGYEYRGKASGSISRDDEGFSGEFSAPDIIYYYKRYEQYEYEEGKGNILQIKYFRDSSFGFRFDISKNGEPLDWCEITRMNSSNDYYVGQWR